MSMQDNRYSCLSMLIFTIRRDVRQIVRYSSSSRWWLYMHATRRRKAQMFLLLSLLLINLSCHWSYAVNKRMWLERARQVMAAIFPHESIYTWLQVVPVRTYLYAVKFSTSNEESLYLLDKPWRICNYCLVDIDFISKDCLHFTLPTDPSTILKPRNPPIDDSVLNKIRRSTDFEALILWKGGSGCLIIISRLRHRQSGFRSIFAFLLTKIRPGIFSEQCRNLELIIHWCTTRTMRDPEIKVVADYVRVRNVRRSFSEILSVFLS